ncbi:MAG TPA: translocation/assembly module TamB, partial [Myxococcaceae bacterium]|nr:translocation/assembly module TamB [Myxococcaceae bacterium]
MKWKPKRGYRRALLLTVLVVAAVALFLRSRWAWDGSCTLARRVLPAVLGMEVGIGRCELDPVSQTVRLYGLSIRPHGADEPLLAADRAEVSGLSVLPFIGVRVGAVRITRPRLSLDLSRPPGAVGKSSECSLDALRAFDLGSLDVRGAEVRIRAPDGRAVELTGVDMGWTSRRGIAAFQLDAARGFVRSSRDGEVLSVTALSVAGEWSPRDDRVDLRKGELGLDEATLALSGSVEDLCAPRFNLEAQLFLPLQALARATRAPPETAAAGHLWSRLALTGSAEAPVL